MYAVIIFTLVLVHKTIAESSSGINVYNPNSIDCSKFAAIYVNEAVSYECPRGYQWNDFMKRCDLSGSKTSYTPKNHYSHDNSPTGYNSVYNTHYGNSRYEISKITRPVAMRCMEGYAFNAYTNRCEVLLPTTSRPKVPYRAPKLLTTMSPGSSPGACPRNVDPNNPVYLPHSQCEKFYMCTPSGPEEWRCPDGLHWSETAKRCDQWWRAGCLRSDGVTAMVTSTISPTVTITTTTIRSSHFAGSTTLTPNYSLTTTASENLGDVVEDTTNWEDFYTTDGAIVDEQIQ